mmetsp:Transcript_36159/g.87455  ORF Transcript_36159/g.87455 Transcript_36159/m.87455 type:complete len:203 (-) Transcript_36159:6218-6826(-)
MGHGNGIHLSPQCFIIQSWRQNGHRSSLFQLGIGRLSRRPQKCGSIRIGRQWKTVNNDTSTSSHPRSVTIPKGGFCHGIDIGGNMRNGIIPVRDILFPCFEGLQKVGSWFSMVLSSNDLGCCIGTSSSMGTKKQAIRGSNSRPVGSHGCRRPSYSATTIQIIRSFHVQQFLQGFLVQSIRFPWFSTRVYIIVQFLPKPFPLQ